MLPGFNHNVRYKGTVVHIQTEDSGIEKAQITTLLFLDGTIIASKKTDYSDILRVEMLDNVVEDLMKEQHKEMLRRLKTGEFDGRAFEPNDSGDRPQESAESGDMDQSEMDKTASPRPFSTPKPGQTLDEIIYEYLVSDRD